MSIATINGSASIGGLNFSLSITRSDEGGISQTVTCPKAWAGVLTDNAGVDAYVTTTLDNDITTEDYITIYWDGGIAYFGAVSSVVDDPTNTVTFDETAILGDALPAPGTAVIIAVEETVVMAFDGDNVSMIATSVAGGFRAHWQFIDADTDVIHPQEVVENEPWFWADGMNWGTPITGDAIVTSYVSCANIAADTVVSLGILYDSVT